MKTVVVNRDGPPTGSSACIPPLGPVTMDERPEARQIVSPRESRQTFIFDISAKS